jgi:hypothetical protein
MGYSVTGYGSGLHYEQKKKQRLGLRAFQALLRTDLLHPTIASNITDVKLKHSYFDLKRE